MGGRRCRNRNVDSALERHPLDLRPQSPSGLGERERAKEVLASADKTYEQAGDAMKFMPLGLLPVPWFDMV